MRQNSEKSSPVKLFQFAFISLAVRYCRIRNDLDIAALPQIILKYKTLSFVHILLYHIITDVRKSSEIFDFMNKRLRLGHYRSVAADPRLKIAPPVLSDLSRNSAKRAPLRVDGLAGRPKRKRATKRKVSNGKYNKPSRYDSIQRAPRTSCGKRVPRRDRPMTAGKAIPLLYSRVL